MGRILMSAPLNSSSVHFIVLPMCADKANISYLTAIIHYCNKTEAVSSYFEHNAPIRNDARIVVHAANVVGGVPMSTPDTLAPCAQSLFRIRIFCPELTQCPHGAKVSGVLIGTPP